MSQAKKNLYFISFLQFIGPIFVILGHAKNGLPYNDFLQGMRTFIYVFHMPLFFFISAYLFSYKGGLEKSSYKDFIKKKFWRLLFPYVVLNLICLIPKILLSSFVQDNMETSVSNFINLWINPRANILGHLWFLFALFEIYLLAPIWSYVIKKNSKAIWILILVISVILRFLTPTTDILAINDLMRNLVFFIIGMWFSKIFIYNLYITLANNVNCKNFRISNFTYKLFIDCINNGISRIFCSTYDNKNIHIN